MAESDVNQFIEFTNATATAITINNSIDWAAIVPTAEFFIRRGLTAGPLSLAGTGITIESNTAAELEQGQVGVLRHKTGTTFLWIGGVAGLPCEIQFSASDLTTPITVGTTKGYLRSPFPFTLTEVRFSGLVAPTGAPIIADLNKSGVSVLSTRCMIDAGEKTSKDSATPHVISGGSVAIADDEEITADFDQVGSTVAGAGIIVTLIGIR